VSIWAGAIALFLLGVVLNGLFAGYETGFVSADRIRIAHRAEEDRDPRAVYLLRHMLAPERMITTVLIGTNGALIIGSMALSSRMPDKEWLATLIAAPVFLVFAEIIPKTIFRRHPNRLALVFLPVIRFFDLLLTPLILPAMWATRGLRWVARVKESPMLSILTTQEDFRSLVDESAARGTIKREEQEMIHSVMDLAAIQAKEIMVPRIDIQAIPLASTRNELVEAFDSTGRTRIPVFKESIDNIVGIVIAHDVLIDPNPEDQTIDRFIKEVRHVPDTNPVGELLQQMKSTRQHMAVVINEYGGTDGIITMEDILEEIFGDIQDEHDLEPRQILQVAPNAYVVDARAALEDFAEVLNIDLGEPEAETVGGWVMHIAQRIPRQGERVQHGSLKITILEGARNQLLKVRVDVSPDRGDAIL
jgi:CBS domain containing-hemolysin-like protein